MAGSTRGFSRYSTQSEEHQAPSLANASASNFRSLEEVIKGLEGSNTELVNRSKTIFFPGDPAEKVYLIRRGAVKLSRVYESVE